MKFALLSAALVLLAVPANAQVLHRTAVVHDGQTVAVTYEPKVETRLRQIGIGPRSTAACMWKSTVSVQRTALDAEGRPIAALTRVVPGTKARSGQRVGHCVTLSEREKARFAGSEQALRAHVAAVAANDAEGLRGELASLASLSAGATHAR